MLVGSESFTLCWCLSPKLALNETLHWLCSGWQQECKQAPLRGGLPLSSPRHISRNPCSPRPQKPGPFSVLTVMRLSGKRESSSHPSQASDRRKLQETEKDSIFPKAKEQSGKKFKTCALWLKYLQKGSFKKLKLKRFICPSKNFKAGTTSPCSPRKEPIAYQE